MSLNITARTLDDLLRLAISDVIKNGIHVSSSKGDNTEIFGAILTLENPRARPSRSVTKGTIFSCLGELLWYLNGSNALDFIQYYIKNYSEFSDDEKSLHGAYGPRIFKSNIQLSQFDTIIKLLEKRPSTRQAVIQIFDGKDLNIDSNDVPCTCNLQFLIRNRKLNMIVTMRSNDVFIGMPHDIFFFTMLQEIVAMTLGIEIGIYKHVASSLHIYQDCIPKATEYIEEGWQPSTEAMPPMPPENPASAIKKILEIEKEIRLKSKLETDLSSLPEYWQDIATLLKVYHLKKNSSSTVQIEKLKTGINHHIYLNYINKIIESKDINDSKSKDQQAKT